MKIKLKSKPVFVPHSIMDSVVDLHAAIDPETGHFICHYFAIAPVQLEIEGELYPGINVGETITVVIGKDAVEAVKNASSPIGITEIGDSVVDGVEVDIDSLALSLSFVKYSSGRISFRKFEEGVIILSEESSKEPPTAILIWRKPKRKEPGSVLTV